jgi:hypothetical protein
MFEIFYDLYEAFEKFRRGRAEVLNPATLYVSVSGWHSSYDKYVKFEGDARQLAEIHVEGLYGGPPRPFMYKLWEKIDSNRSHYAREIFNENIEYDRHDRGWYVDWDAISYELQTVCIENLMPEVSAELPPINEKSARKKEEAGYGGGTLYASYQLSECIYVGVD